MRTAWKLPSAIGAHPNWKTSLLAGVSVFTALLSSESHTQAPASARPTTSSRRRSGQPSNSPETTYCGAPASLQRARVLCEQR